MTTALTPPLKWHGGKHYLARRLVSLMPSHLTYCEPFAGGLSVLLSKPCNGVSEVVNDADGRLTNFWRVLQDVETFGRFRRIVEAIPFSEPEWRDADTRQDDADPIRAAVAFFVRCRQSLAGRMDAFAPLSKTRTRRGMCEQSAAWLSAVDGLPAVHARLRRVAILNRPAVDVLRSLDHPDTLFYLDPPYLPSTRAAKRVYAFEMTTDDHLQLLAMLRQCTGKVMISGYRTDLYDRELSDWHRVDFEMPNHAAAGRTKRRMTESVWCNIAPSNRGAE